MLKWLILLATIPQPGTIAESVDVIEVNHFYAESTDENFPLTHKLVFTQIIFRNWNGFYCEHEIVAWRMMKCRTQWPRFDHAKGVWVCEFYDGNIHRRIEALTFNETKTTYDPEVDERSALPTNKRRGLIGK